MFFQKEIEKHFFSQKTKSNGIEFFKYAVYGSSFFYYLFICLNMFVNFLRIKMVFIQDFISISIWYADFWDYILFSLMTDDSVHTNTMQFQKHLQSSTDRHC